MPNIDKNLSYFLPGYNEHLAIIANGQFPTDSQIIQTIIRSKIIIACDGAVNNLKQHNMIADYVIGDGDSALIVTDETSRNPYIHIPDQNSNDLSKAVNFAISNFRQLPIIIYAANGLREDHSIANFALLEDFGQKHANIAMLSDYGIFNISNGEIELPTLKGQQISLFAINSKTTVTCKELKWPLKNFTPTSLYSGTLNQAVSTLIKIKNNGCLIIYRAFETKLT